MEKHTKFDSSDDEAASSHREKKSHKKEKKEEKRDRSRSPHERREKSPRREHKSDNRRRDDYKEKDRRRDSDRNNWKSRNNERRNNYNERKEDRLSAEQIAAQRKALWGNKKGAEPAVNPESTSSDAPAPSSSSGGVAKNEKLWSSAIAATGVASSQANKFMRLMGVKNAPKPTEDSSNLSAEKNRQDKMLNDLEKQYAVARETAHMGRGNGLGFGH